MQASAPESWWRKCCLPACLFAVCLLGIVWCCLSCCAFTAISVIRLGTNLVSNLIFFWHLFLYCRFQASCAAMRQVLTLITSLSVSVSLFGLSSSFSFSFHWMHCIMQWFTGTSTICGRASLCGRAIFRLIPSHAAVSSFMSCLVSVGESSIKFKMAPMR